jgi:hypothetical protein
MIVNDADGIAADLSVPQRRPSPRFMTGAKRMISPLPKVLAAAALTVSAMSWPSDHVQEQNTNAVQQEVSVAEIDRTLRAIDVDRTSGSDGERASAKYLDGKLAEYGIAHMMYDSHLYLSWPGRAELVVPAIGTIRGKTAAFSAATPKDGLRGRVVFEPKLTRRVDQSLAFDSDVRGRIPVVRGIADTEALVLAGRLARSLFFRSMRPTSSTRTSSPRPGERRRRRAPCDCRKFRTFASRNRTANA